MKKICIFLLVDSWTLICTKMTKMRSYLWKILLWLYVKRTAAPLGIEPKCQKCYSSIWFFFETNLLRHPRLDMKFQSKIYLPSHLYRKILIMIKMWRSDWNLITSFVWLRRFVSRDSYGKCPDCDIGTQVCWHTIKLI